MIRTSTLCLLLLTLTGLAPIFAIDHPSYRATFPARRNHYVEVRVDIPTHGQGTSELRMAAWTPGSYKIRDYARFVEGLAAHTPSGAPLSVEKVAKDRWQVLCAGIDHYRLTYRVYGREMTVRTNFVEESFAMLNGAATWIIPHGSEQAPYDVQFVLPAEWTHSETGLPAHPDGAAHHYLAPDYDTLVDCPVLLGTLNVQEFAVEGIPHFLVSSGGDDLWDFEKAALDCKKIVEAEAAMWEVIPYQSYRFLNMIVESGGGLEHKNSTLMMTSRFSFRDPDRYLRWLGLVSHEFFHTWNVKRLRPIALGPFDYSREVHTDDLWVVEGITSYYDDLMLARAGLTDRKKYLKALSGQIEGVQKTPGREVHALRETSHDAWTHFYQRHENSLNSTISYYTKGAVVGFLLDLEIRRATGGEKSLDDAMRLAYERYSGERGYTSAEFRRCCTEVANAALAGFFARSVDSREELEYEAALEWLGLRFKPADEEKKDNEEESESDPESTTEGEDSEAEEDGKDEKPIPGWIGLSASDRGGRLVVTTVKRGTLAFDIGLNVDDEVLAVDRYRVGGGGWSARMKQYSPGDTVTLLVARRGQILSIPVTLGEKPKESWALQLKKDATPQQKRRLAAWLGEAGTDLIEEATADEAALKAKEEAEKSAEPLKPSDSEQKR